MLLLCAGVLIFIISQTSSGKVSSADISTVSQNTAVYVNADAVKEADANMIKRLYGLDPSSYEGIVLYYPVSNMDADEMCIIKLKDTSQQETVRAALEARLETQLKSFEGYGIEQTAMLNAAQIYVSGNYALYFSGDGAAEALAAFKASL